MKKLILKSSIASLLGIATIIAPCAAYGQAPAATDECAKELLLSYFPKPIVAETLKKFNVPQDKWEGIQQSLSNKDKEIVKTVEQKASSMNPNPLKDPQQRQAAVKLFRETLLQVFSDALRENGLTDSNQFQAMLDDIQQQKAKKFAMCMEQKRATMQQSATGTTAPESDESDADDADDKDDTDDTEEEPAKTESTEPVTK